MSTLRLMWTYRIGPRKAWRIKRLLDSIDNFQVERYGPGAND